jgi:hypothetical protein
VAFFAAKVGIIFITKEDKDGKRHNIREKGS